MKLHVLFALFALIVATSSEDPLPTLQYHLATFQHVLQTRHTSMLLKMIPNETYEQEHLEKLYLAYQNIRFHVNSADSEGNQIHGNVTLIRTHPTRPQNYSTIMTIVQDNESPTKWRMLLAEPVAERRQFREWPCLIGFIWCFGCLVLTDDCNLFGPW